MDDYTIWIEAEEWDAGEWTPRDDVTDVIVTRDDGSRWIASFCAYDHVATLRRNCQESGENLGGKYLWASDLVLVDSTARESVELVVRDLMEAEEFDGAFSEMTDDDDGDEDEDDEDDRPTFEPPRGPTLLS